MHAFRMVSLFALSLLTFLILDAVWLGVVAGDMYRRSLGHLMAPQIRWGAAAVFYLVYVAGLLLLVVLPNAGAPLPRVAALGAVFGLVAYATYDLTNLATLQGWPLAVTVADLLWGAVVTGVTAAASSLCAGWLVP